MNTNNVSRCIDEFSTALREVRKAALEPPPAAELCADVLAELVPCFDLMVDGIEELRSLVLQRHSIEATLRMLALVNDRGSVGVAFTLDAGVLLTVDKPAWSTAEGRQYWERTVIGNGATLELAALDAITRITDEQLQAHAHEIVIG